MIIGVLWLVSFIALLIWILGLALSWGLWVWFFFVTALFAVNINILGLTGKKSGMRFGRRR